MITQEYLSECVEKVKITSDEKDKENKLPLPFVSLLSENDKQIYKHTKNAIIDGDYSQASLLLNILLLPDIKPIVLNKLLIEFCEIGDLNAFNFIIDQGADIYYSNNMPFVTACRNGNLNLVLAFIEIGIKPNSIPQALVNAASGQQKEIIMELIKVELDINLNNSEALRICADQGLSDMVDFLIQQGADVHALNDRALILATSKGHTDTVRVLLHHGSNPNVWDGKCFKIAKEKNYHEILELLTNRKKELDKEDNITNTSDNDTD
ncbi:repeat protein [Tupanvirus deep ocean]|uniref:Repeat protein n=2 Tax=Tupanvirus TaxID=2094720 RepID=A0AC62A8L4_9VIRU|nr:repeat protein [Tupanvirus deep ocean]QKU34111.1 repeat protein [Tupanvirus deep ocean]